MKRAAKNKGKKSGDGRPKSSSSPNNAGATAPSAPPASSPSDPTTRWTFLTNHAHVLAVLDSDPQIVLREVAIRVGITERAVQRIIQDLEQGGFIRRTKVGRRNQYEMITDESLRHPIEAHRKIGDLLKLINH